MSMLSEAKDWYTVITAGEMVVRHVLGREALGKMLSERQMFIEQRSGALVGPVVLKGKCEQLDVEVKVRYDVEIKR